MKNTFANKKNSKRKACIDLTSAESEPKKTTSTTPPRDKFVALSDVPKDVSSPEAECLEHTTSVIRRRISARTKTSCTQYTQPATTDVPSAIDNISPEDVELYTKYPPESNATLITRLSQHSGSHIVDEQCCAKCKYSAGELRSQRYSLLERLHQVTYAIGCKYSKCVCNVLCLLVRSLCVHANC